MYDLVAQAQFAVPEALVLVPRHDVRYLFAEKQLQLLFVHSSRPVVEMRLSGARDHAGNFNHVADSSLRLFRVRYNVRLVPGDSAAQKPFLKVNLGLKTRIMRKWRSSLPYRGRFLRFRTSGLKGQGLRGTRSRFPPWLGLIYVSLFLITFFTTGGKL